MSQTKSEQRGGTFWDGLIICPTVDFMLIFFFFLSKFLKPTKTKKRFGNIKFD